MLPNIENTDALTLNFEKSERTKTFRIGLYKEKVNITNALLGQLVLGTAILGNKGTNTNDTGGVLQSYITLTATWMD